MVNMSARSRRPVRVDVSGAAMIAFVASFDSPSTFRLGHLSFSTEQAPWYHSCSDTSRPAAYLRNSRSDARRTLHVAGELPRTSRSQLNQPSRERFEKHSHERLAAVTPSDSST